MVVSSISRNSAFAVGARHAIALNATGIAHLSLTAENVLGVRAQYDLDDIVPSTTGGMGFGGYMRISPPGPPAAQTEDAALIIDWQRP